MKIILPTVLVLFSAVAAAEGPINVTVMGGNANPYTGDGLYVEYSINGTTYRSNEVGQKINDIAWANMSYVDKKKVADYYGSYIGRRKADFGNDCSAAIAKLVDDAQGVTEAQEILKQKWVETDFPGYAERFHPDNRDEYFEQHLTPGIDCSISSLQHDYPEIYEKYRELQFDFACACEGYDALERFDSLRHQYAVEFISKELIQIIIDQVLMPNITVSGVGTIAAKINGAILDHRDNIRKLAKAIKDKDLDLKNDSSEPRNRMQLYNAILDENKALIQAAMHAAQAMKTEIETAYTAAKTAREAQLAQVAAAAAVRRQEVEAVRVDGVPNAEIVAENEDAAHDLEARKHAESQARNAYDAACAAHGSSSPEAHTAWNQYDAAVIAVTNKEAEIARKQAALFDSCVVRMRDWYEGYRTSYCNLTNSYPWVEGETLDFPLGSQRYQAYLVLLDGGKVEYFQDMPDADAAQVKSAVSTHLSTLTAVYGEVKTWQLSANELSKEARGAYDEILSDYHSITNTVRDWWVYCQEDQYEGYAAGIFNVAAEFLKRVGGVEPVDSTEDYWANKKKTVEARVDEFDDARNLYKDAKAADYQTFRALMADRDLAIAAYFDAYGAISNLVETAPSYLQDQTANYGILSISPSTELGRMFLGSGHTGTVADAELIRDELLSFRRQYDQYCTQMDNAAVQIRLLESDLVHYRWTVEGTSEYSDSESFGPPGRTAAMYDYGNVVTALSDDFAWSYPTAVLLECCQDLHDNKDSYSVRGSGDSGYYGTKSRLENVLTQYGYQVPFSVLNAPLRLAGALLTSPSYSTYTYSLNGYIPWEVDLYASTAVPLLAAIETARADLSDYDFPVTAAVDASVTNHWRALAWYDRYDRAVPSNLVVRIATERKDEIFIDATDCVPTILGLDEPEWKGTVRISGEVNSDETQELRGRVALDDNTCFYVQTIVKSGAVVTMNPCNQFNAAVTFEAGSAVDVQLDVSDDNPWGPPSSFHLTNFPAKPTFAEGAHLLINGVEQSFADWEVDNWGQISWKGTTEKPTVSGDGDAEVSGSAYTGYTVRPGDGVKDVVVSIPEGLPASRVTIEVKLGRASTLKIGGAAVRIKNYSGYSWSYVDITDYLDLPEPDALGVIDLSAVKVKDEIVREVFDPARGAEIDFRDTSWPIIRIAPTRIGLVYHLREGTSLENLAETEAFDGNGYDEPYNLYLSVTGGTSAFYSVTVTP